MEIKKIIHQVWEGRTTPNIPSRLKLLAETWKKKNPTWEYRLWTGNEMDELVNTHFKDFLPTYLSFPHNVQRWDAIRFMILYIEGGVYADLDTECYMSIDDLLKNKTLCFGEEPPGHTDYLLAGLNYFLGNAFMASTVNNKAWLHLLDEIKKSLKMGSSHLPYVLNTTGPLMISRNFQILTEKYQASLLPYNLVSPVDKNDVLAYASGVDIQSFQEKIKDAYCGHYFFGSWEKSISIY